MKNLWYFRSYMSCALTLVLVLAVPQTDADSILERADAILEEAKSGYELARSTSSVPAFVDASFKLEEARIKYLVLQEITQGEKQKLAADRLRVVNQLNKLIHDGKVAVMNPPPPKPADASLPPEAPPSVESPAKPGNVGLRSPVPELANQKEAERLVKDLFKEQYAKKAPADRGILGRRLLEQAGRTGPDMAGRWVLYREAQDAAAAAGDLTTALASADGLALHFDVDGLLLRNAAVTATAKAARFPTEFTALGESLMDLAGAHLAVDQYAEAEKALTQAVQHAKRAGDAALLARATARTKSVLEAKAKHVAMKRVLDTLSRNSEDGQANLEMGQFLCFFKDSWDLGLRFLVKGADPVLKSLAGKELSYTAQREESAALGDAWWDLAEKEKAGIPKAALQGRALFWYETALPEAKGLNRVRIEKRVSEVSKVEEPSTTGLVGRWLCNENAGTKVSDTSGKNQHGTMYRGVKWASGSSGSALSFEGNGYVSFSASGLPAPAAPQTIAWAMKLATNNFQTQNVIVMDDAAARLTLGPGIRDGRVAVWKYGGIFLVSTPSPPPGEWHSFAYTYDGSTHKLYVDGLLRDSTTEASQTGTHKRLEFGRWVAADSEYFRGDLDEVRIYSRTLSEAEVRLLARLRK